MMRLIVTALVVMLAGAVVHAAEDVRPLIEEANAAYADGAGRLSSDHDGAVAAFARSAALAKRAAAASPDPPAALMYNIGNACLLAGDPGEAVLWYKRAERLTPNDAALRTNLAAARAKVASGASVQPKDSLLDQLTIIEFVPPRVRFWVAIAAFTLMWTLALWRLRGQGWKPSRLVVGACAAAGIVAGASLAPREMRLREAAEAVVLRETTGRAGPDEGTYEAKPSSPLKAGTEVRVVEERGSWVLVELGDGGRSWLSGKAVERVAMVGI